MTKLLVIFNGNWADEMDIDGLKLMDKDEWEKYVQNVPDKKFTIHIGSNEELEYGSRDEYLYDFKMKELTDEEYEVLHKFFPYEFGTFPEVDIDEER